MQFHLNGFRSGDPRVQPARARDDENGTVDVLIVGCGPAGLTLAAQLSAFPDITTRIVERKPGPLEIGQADGVACRSMEMFEAFGFADRVAEEAYWVNEVTFWRPAPSGELTRADRIQDVEDDLSHQPHVILNQARVHDFFLEMMRTSPQRLEPDYDRALDDLSYTDDPDYPVRATLVRSCADSPREEVRARFVVGCDGARSAVRRFIGHDLKGLSARQLWGVMDVLAITDFPDIRLKCAIQSADSGSMLIIPREGGYMVRLYIELDALAEGERSTDRSVTSEALVARARAVLSPWSLEVREIAWWSAYEIGQRVCDAFDDVPSPDRQKRTPRIFIAGDACHTHSPKAGQGMNVSMADSFNLGWKLAAVLRGQAEPRLLHTYSEERQAKARELIDFDRDMARLFSARPRDDEEARLFQTYFQKHGRYTAGVETRYAPSTITGPGDHQALAKGFMIGQRFHSAPVVRLADAKTLQLAETLKADGRWRLIAFARRDDHGGPGQTIASLCTALTAPGGAIDLYTPRGGDPDAVIDLRTVFQQCHRDLAIQSMPSLLLPAKGRLGLIDYEKIFCPDLQSGPDIFDHRGIDRDRGALVIVRPDQFVAEILPLDRPAAIADFLGAFMIAQIPNDRVRQSSASLSAPVR